MEPTKNGLYAPRRGLGMAAWEPPGKALARPAYARPGGPGPDRVDLSYSVANQVVEADLEEVSWLVEQGFDVLKIKTGVLEENDEVARFAAIRAAVGDDFDLRIDFNQGGKPERAIVLCKRLEE